MEASTLPGQATIEAVLEVQDPVGVLSFYVDADPTAEAHTRPPWQIQLKNDLRALRKELRAEHDHARRTAVEKRLDDLEPALEYLVDPGRPGRGRALFAGVGSGQLHTFSLQAPLTTETTFGEIPHVLPLLRVDDGHPRVVVLGGHDAVRVIETRLGRADEVRDFDIEPVVFGDRERRGPAAPNPGRGRHSVNHRERWERHLEADQQRRLARAADELARLAPRRGWALGVVSGDGRVAEPLAQTLEQAGVATELSHADLIDVTPAHAVAELAPFLDAAAARRQLGVARRAREAAAAGGHGAVGLESVLECLLEARVDTLVIDGDRRIDGAVTADGLLAGPRDGLPPDPQFADRLVLNAHRTGARTAVVCGPAVAALADVGGVAAVLRG